MLKKLANKKYTAKFFKQSKHTNIKKIDNYIKKRKKLLKNKNKTAIFNYTGVDLPQEVTNILSLAPNFAIQKENENKIKLKLIKDVEYMITKLDTIEKLKDTLRNKTINVITNHVSKRENIKGMVKIIQKQVNITRKFLKKHSAITVTRSDKDKIDVKRRIHNKVNMMLEDKKNTQY